MTPPLRPGERLADRYRLDVLLSDVAGARFWRATDLVLARSVGVHVVSHDDERACALIEAAQASAQVTDTHLLQVLDCEDDGTNAWVVAEWGHGSTLDLLIEQRVLSPVRTAWAVREVAHALAAAHQLSLAHGALRPERVLISDGGDVKVRGFMIDTALHGSSRPDDLDEIEADIVNLAALLYAGITGRWPGTVPSSVPAPPDDLHGPLRPRQVRQGVPRILDTICERVLRKEAHDHVLPIETSAEVEAALTEFLGNPEAAAPQRLSEMYVDPGQREHEPSPFGSGRPRNLGHLREAVDPADTQPSMPPVWDTNEDVPLTPYVESLDRPLFSVTARRQPGTSSTALAKRGSDEWLFGAQSRAASRKPVGRHGGERKGVLKWWPSRR